MKLKKGTFLFILLSCLIYNALAQVTQDGYILQDDDVTIHHDGIITKCNKCPFDNKRIIIPEKIGGITIKGIKSSVFKNQNLVAVTFAKESKVVSIGSYAFKDNPIAKLTLPPLLTTIGNYTFQNNMIETLDLPASIETISEGAFKDNQIAELTLPTSLTTIGNYTFQNNMIETLDLPASIETISEGAFKDNQIAELTLPTTLTTIAHSAFRNNQITKLTLPEGLTTIQSSAFYDNQIAELTLPTSLITIGDGAFENNKIITLIIPNDAQLMTIGDNAFQSNDGDAGGNKLTTLTLPPSLTVIGDSAFYNNSLTTVIFNDDPNKSKIKNIEKDAFSGNTKLNDEGITLPKHAGGDDVKYKDSKDGEYIQGDRFTDFTISLVTVIFPHTLTADDVDLDDKGIITKCHCGNFVSNSIIIPVQIDGKTITGIVDKTWPDKGIFQDKNLVAVVFEGGSQVISIGEQAFNNNPITELTLPTVLTSIGERAFYGNPITELTLPTALKTIGRLAFYGNKITELPFPEDSKLTTIGERAFQSNQIETLTLPTALTTIERNAFDSNEITELTFPEDSKLTSIGILAFNNNKITELTFPEDSKLTSIGILAFKSNPLESFILPSVTIEGGRTYWRDESWADLGTSSTILKADFGKYFELVYIEQFTLTVTVNNADRGTVTPDNLSFSFDKGQSSTQELTATSNEGWRFDKWVISDEEDKNDNPTIVTVDADKTATAHFVKQETLTLAIVGEGSINRLVESNEGVYDIVTLTATPANQDWRFDKWVITGEEDQNGNPITVTVVHVDVTVDADKTATAHFVKQETLTLAIVGEGSINRLVESNEGVYDIVTLTATPANQDWRFDKWVISGEEDENGNPITVTVVHVDVTVDADKTATAHFVKLVTLTLAIVGEGSITRSVKPNEGVYDINTKVTITAEPNPGWRFDKWVISDEEDKKDNYIALTVVNVKVDADKTATAHFVKQVKLTLAIVGEGSINPSIKPNSVDPDNVMKGMYDINTEVTLTAEPNLGWRFDKWVITGEEDENGNPITVTVVNVDVTVDANKTATAHFVKQVTLTTKVEGRQGGTITRSVKPNGKVYDINTNVTITAEPDPGWRFDKWVISDEEDKKDNYITVTVDADKTATAHFVKQVKLTLAIVGEGSINRSVEPTVEHNNVGVYDINTEVTLTATPANQDWRFDKWVITGEEDENGNPITVTVVNVDVTVDADKTATAHFVKQVTLTLAIVGEGSITRSVKPNEGVYDINTKVTLTATPANQDWRFDKWVITSEEDENDKTTITLDTDKSVTAHFVELVTLTLTIEETEASGEVSGLSAGNNKIDKGADFKLKAIPTLGQKFVSWNIGGKTIMNEEYTLPATYTETGISITVTFEAIPQQVTLTLDIEGEGSINPSIKPNSVDPDNVMKGMYDINTEVTLTATPANQDWRFDKWVITGEEDENGNPITVTVDTDKTATAHFVQQVTLNLTIVETGASNKVSGLSAGDNKIDKRINFELKAVPALGQRFVSWNIGEQTIVDNPYTLTAIATDISITVTFKAIPQQVTLTLDIEGEGSINPSIKPNSVDPDNVMKGMYDINTEVDLTATPNEGWKFDKWVITGEEDKNDSTITVTVDADKSVTAHFVKEEEEEAITSILTEVVSATPYPNPATSQITLKAKDSDLIQLFSQKGEQQYSVQHTGNEVHTIDVSTLPVGVYLVRITDAEGNTTTKRILKK